MKIMRFKFVWENAIVTWYSVSISFFKSLVTRRTPVSGSIWKYLEAFPRPIISYLTWNYMFSGGPNWNYQTYFVSRSSSVRISGHQSSNCTSNGGVIFQSYWMGNYCKHRRNVITILKYNNLFNTTSFSIKPNKFTSTLTITFVVLPSLLDMFSRVPMMRTCWLSFS